MRTISLFSFLMSSVLFMGCPKKQELPDNTDGPNPRYEFVMGVRLLEKPDKKTGAYDYMIFLSR